MLKTVFKGQHIFTELEESKTEGNAGVKKADELRKSWEKVKRIQIGDDGCEVMMGVRANERRCINKY